jgi:urease accessory protein
LHPLFGLDHLLAMVAVGLLAVRFGGRARWYVPAAFLACMTAGGALAAWHVPVFGVEYGVMLSVLVFGLLIGATALVPAWFGALLVGAFAMFHGYAHVAELSAGGAVSTYTAGFLLATAMLHAVGILAGAAIARWLDARALRWAGSAIAAAGILLLAGVI